MSDYTTTPNLHLYKPNPGADVDTWGDHLNANADLLDAALSPTGSFLPIAGGTLTGTLTLGPAPSLVFSVLPPNAANDAAAAAAGVPVRGVYRNGSVLMVRVT
jgi:hypothetical protein